MSIFRKITLLFLVSLLLMFLIAYQVEKINRQKVEMVITQKYLEDAKKIFAWLAVRSPDALGKKIQALGLDIKEESEADEMETLLTQAHSFGEIRILRSDEGAYLLRVQYFDDLLLLEDREFQKSLQEQWLLNLLLLFDIAVLVVIFLILLKMLLPLRKISAKMKAFAEGEYDSRVAVESRDEIGEVAGSYNTMAQKLQDLIIAREALLRDVSHELRTPISKGYFALEALTPSPEKEIIKKSFSELERLSAELLEIERLQALDEMSYSLFGAETLILESLSKLMVEDESKIEIVVKENFTIEGDLTYLSTALKNLIDNALKYTVAYPVAVTAENSTIMVQNRGAPLKNNMAYYLEPFTQEEGSRHGKGYGLGLNIVQKILRRHGWKLSYLYTEGFHRFSIMFGTQGKGDSAGEY